MIPFPPKSHWLADTSLQKTTGYLPADDGAKAAFKDADIIVIPAGIPRMSTSTPDSVPPDIPPGRPTPESSPRLSVC